MTPASSTPSPIRHYLWAGLDFMFDSAGRPVLLDANRASHMMVEYMAIIGDQRPFALTAARMNQAGGAPCLLWRRDEPQADGGEDAPFMAHHLSKHLAAEPVVCNVEDNQEPRADLIARDGRRVRPGSIFRWWYGLPWSYERTGTLVVNPNAVWAVVRDKGLYPGQFANAEHFRVAAAFPVATEQEAVDRIAEHHDVFAHGFVLKPRVGWGGHGVQVGDAGARPGPVSEPSVLCERVMPPRRNGRFWDVRVFVMDGEYLGGIEYSSVRPVTNFHQGGSASPLDPELARRLREPALEAVCRIDALAHAIYTLPKPPDTPLVNVTY